MNKQKVEYNFDCEVDRQTNNEKMNRTWELRSVRRVAKIKISYWLGFDQDEIVFFVLFLIDSSQNKRVIFQSVCWSFWPGKFFFFCTATKFCYVCASFTQRRRGLGLTIRCLFLLQAQKDSCTIHCSALQSFWPVISNINAFGLHNSCILLSTEA